ncbi:helix-turn-helix domain-containing protein [Leptolyngbya sp. AN02str]|uniref:helix-turn-helix domain-containing protein n=1 Tax=Leptolyngbya sp. AN02str TaxID=3423363 RepID=UPI003D3237EA
MFISTPLRITLAVRWRLRELMARQRVTNKELAEQLGIHPNAVSRMKNQDTLPHIGGETLNALCKYLNCTPNDLIEYMPDSDEEAQQ